MPLPVCYLPQLAHSSLVERLELMGFLVGADLITTAFQKLHRSVHPPKRAQTNIMQSLNYGYRLVKKILELALIETATGISSNVVN